MSEAINDRIEEILIGALQCAGDDRAAFLDAACGDDVADQRRRRFVAAIEEPVDRILALDVRLRGKPRRFEEGNCRHSHLEPPKSHLAKRIYLTHLER